MGNADARKRFLIISPEVIGANMAGPGMRYWELARALARHVDVTLAAPDQAHGVQPEGFQLAVYQFDAPDSLRALASSSDAVLIATYLLYRFPFLGELECPLAVDIYIPSILENLEIHSAREMPERLGIHTADLNILNQLIGVGDFFLCASEKQRDFWLGVLAANNRINPLTYQADPTLRRLVDVVPIGLPDMPPVHTRQALKGIHPGIGADDTVILWGGGIWEWFDPLTLIRALARLADEAPQLKLFFMGVRHPNPLVPEMRMVAQARDLARELGLLDRRVFFNDWVAYHERQNYLLEADIGVSLHLDHIETRLSFRTRLLDYIWAGLPMIVTGGDALSELIAQEGLGIVVPPGDVDAVAQGLRLLVSQPDARAAYRARFQAVAPRLTWQVAARPLCAFACAPWYAADRTLRFPGAPAVTPPPPTPLWALPLKAVRMLITRGPRALAAEMRAYLKWKRSSFCR